MRKIKLVIEYDGYKYHGWQIQPNGITIQSVLEEKLRLITKKKTSVLVAGRTDAKVHAEAQAAHFVTRSRMTPREFLRALNSVLPKDISIKKVEEVDSDFHARKSAKGRIYRYTILNRDYPSALQRRYSWFIPQPLDLPAIRRAKKCLIGRHEFSAFRASGCEAESPVKEIYRIDIKRKGDFLELTFEGNGFVKYMIRNIVGTLVQVGKGQLAAGQVAEILESRNRKLAGPTAPAYGLKLVKVIY
ncbi:MAG: tRNA pseudouridine(38-40) synthase TruA [Nitrospinae bacterium]|nr:tRNA pseudouridine(38-40) synthase TruA [Nitrospinota bacterium]